MCTGNTEVAVVLMPTIRMLSLPTALFHSPPLCVCVRVCETTLQVPAASSSLVTGCTLSNVSSLQTRKLSEETGFHWCTALWWQNSTNTAECCGAAGSCTARESTPKRDPMCVDDEGGEVEETYLVQSLKSSLQGLCSSLSRHPATTS